MPKGDGGGRNNGGKKPGAGRKSGVPNKISREDREKEKAQRVMFHELGAAPRVHPAKSRWEK